MKRIIIILISVVTLSATSRTQTIDEALWYSQIFYGGTARFMAMGGAFTALGGDLSVLSQNPAGLGVYRSVDISFSPQMYYNLSDTKYNGDTGNDYAYQFHLNQGGIAYPLISDDNTDGLAGLTIGYSYNRTNNFNINTIINGVNTNSSMADFWANSAADIHYTELDGAPGIAFDSWMIDTLNGSGGYNYGTIFSQYGDDTFSTYGQTVRRIITNEGFGGEHAFSIAANFSHKLYVGATLGINKFNSYYQYEHYEVDADDNIFDFSSFSYLDNVQAEGTGFAFKMGVIVKPVSILRLGFAFHAPTIYKVNEYYYDDIRTDFDNGDFEEFSNEAFRFSYTLSTPMRAMAGAAVQIGKIGLISADYEFVDYRMSRFSNASDDYNYYNENQDIKDIYDVAHNLRLGGELRLSSLYFRGGYSMYGSAFVRGEDNQDFVYSVYSAGFGLRQNNFTFDFAYSLGSTNQKYFMYNHPDINAAEIAYTKHMISATLGFRF